MIAFNTMLAKVYVRANINMESKLHETNKLYIISEELREKLFILTERRLSIISHNIIINMHNTTYKELGILNYTKSEMLSNNIYYAEEKAVFMYSKYC